MCEKTDIFWIHVNLFIKCTYVYTSACTVHVGIDICVYACIYEKKTYICMYIYIHVYMYKCVYIYIHIYMYV